MSESAVVSIENKYVYITCIEKENLINYYLFLMIDSNTIIPVPIELISIEYPIDRSIENRIYLFPIRIDIDDSKTELMVDIVYNDILLKSLIKIRYMKDSSIIVNDKYGENIHFKITDDNKSTESSYLITKISVNNISINDLNIDTLK